MGVKIGELFVSLGFDVDDTKLKGFNDKIVAARNELFKVSAAAAAAVAGISELISTPLERASQFKQFTDQFGYSAEKMQEWARVASTVNNTLSFDAALSKYKAFAEFVRTSAFTGQGMALSQLGATVVPGKTPDEYLEELSAKARSGDWQKRFGGEKLYRSQVIPLLNQIGLGGDYFDSLLTTASQRGQMTQGRTMNDNQTRQLDALMGKIKDVGRAYEKFAQDFAITHGDQIINFMNKFLALLEKAIPLIEGFANGVDHLAKSLGGWVKVGEYALDFYAARWAIGMVGAISKVTSAMLIYNMTNTGMLAGAAGFLGVAGSILTAGAAGLGGFMLGKTLMEQSGLGQKFADWAAPTNGDNVLARSAHWAAGVNKGAQVNQNLTFHITGSARAEDVARDVREEIDRQNNKAYGQINLGAAH